MLDWLVTSVVLAPLAICLFFCVFVFHRESVARSVCACALYMICEMPCACVMSCAMREREGEEELAVVARRLLAPIKIK